jgi:hypothetical protein
MTLAEPRRECHVLSIAVAVYHEHLGTGHSGPLSQRHPLCRSRGRDLEIDIAGITRGSGGRNIDVKASAGLRTEVHVLGSDDASYQSSAESYRELSLASPTPKTVQSSWVLMATRRGVRRADGTKNDGEVEEEESEGE